MSLSGCEEYRKDVYHEKEKSVSQNIPPRNVVYALRRACACCLYQRRDSGAAGGRPGASLRRGAVRKLDAGGFRAFGSTGLGMLRHARGVLSGGLCPAGSCAGRYAVPARFGRRRNRRAAPGCKDRPTADTCHACRDGDFLRFVRSAGLCLQRSVERCADARLYV